MPQVKANESNVKELKQTTRCLKVETLDRRVAILTSHFFQSHFAQFSTGKERLMNRLLPTHTIHTEILVFCKSDLFKLLSDCFVLLGVNQRSGYSHLKVINA